MGVQTCCSRELPSGRWGQICVKFVIFVSNLSNLCQICAREEEGSVGGGRATGWEGRWRKGGAHVPPCVGGGGRGRCCIPANCPEAGGGPDMLFPRTALRQVGVQTCCSRELPSGRWGQIFVFPRTALRQVGSNRGVPANCP